MVLDLCFYLFGLLIQGLVNQLVCDMPRSCLSFLSAEIIGATMPRWTCFLNVLLHLKLELIDSEIYLDCALLNMLIKDLGLERWLRG